MVGMSDEEAKAIQEVAKTTGKGIDAAEKAGGFFSRVFGQPIEDTVGMYWGDKVRARRIERAIDLSVSVQEKLENAAISNIRTLPDKIAIPLIEQATLEDDPVLKEMWGKLVAASLDPLERQIEKEHINVLGNMSSRDAMVLQALYERRYVGGNYHSDRYDEDELKEKGIMHSFYHGYLDKVLKLDLHNVRNLHRLDVLQSVISYVNVLPEGSLSADEDIEAEEVGVSSGFEELEFSTFGLDFANKVIG